MQNNVGMGFYYFDPGFTSSNSVAGTGGDSMASFLLGYPDYAYILTANPTAAATHYPDLYFNDNWHTSRRLTLNLGARWEFTGPYTERHNRLSYFDSSAVDPTLAAAGLNYPGTAELVDSDGYHYRSSFKPDWKEFSPRVGAAYLLPRSTVLQAGYGVFWLPGDVSNQIGPNSDAVNSYYTGMVVTSGSTLPINSISNPYPGGLIAPPGRSESYLDSTLLGGSISDESPNNPYAYAQQWNVGIQKQLSPTLVIDVAYGGAKGTHLPIYSLPIDQLPDADLTMGNKLLTQVSNPFYGIISPSQDVGAATTTAGQLLRPYPQYNGVALNAADEGDSTYNSLQVKAQKRLPRGASILLAYTHAKLISNTDTLTSWLEPSVGGAGGSIQDANNLRAEKALSSNDVPNRLVVAYILDVPVGQGQKYLSSLRGIGNEALGGWGVSGITTLQSGFPLSFTTSQNLTYSFNNTSRPDVVPGCRKSNSGSAVSRLNGWFNTSCFTQPGAFTFGDESREDSTLRSPGIADWDFSVFKTFPFRKDSAENLQFRTEVFNLFNRVQFGYPGETQGTTSFGVINSQYNLPRLVQFALRLGF